MTDSTDERAINKLARATADQVVEGTDDVLWRVARHLPFLNGVVAKRERSLARAQCAEMLDICGTLKAGNADLEGEALYVRAISKLLSCDAPKAREIVRLADQSFAQWPEERDVNLRDIMNYLIVNQILVAHTKALGTQSDVEQIVRASIPEGL
ncbi:MAG: hypothetical protein ACRENS_03805 [Candidatus Eiseniibacteriota bacterium]